MIESPTQMICQGTMNVGGSGAYICTAVCTITESVVWAAAAAPHLSLFKAVHRARNIVYTTFSRITIY